MKQILSRIGDALVFLTLIIGIVAVTYGASLIFWPAGFLVGGTLTITLAVLAILGKEEDDGQTGQGH